MVSAFCSGCNSVYCSLAFLELKNDRVLLFFNLFKLYASCILSAIYAKNERYFENHGMDLVSPLFNVNRVNFFCVTSYLSQGSFFEELLKK